MKHYYVTCIGKGGLYRVFPHSTGAGTSRGQTLVVYQDVNSNEVYHRTIEDFALRMKTVNTGDDCFECDGKGYHDVFCAPICHNCKGTGIIKLHIEPDDNEND